MSNAIIAQGLVTEGRLKNTQAFRDEYRRLNSGEQMEVQKAFCQHYGISSPAFRARLSGDTRVSDSELVWFKKRVATYFPA
ncbi:hypothetical protein [Spirosoma sp. KNUC1025]|uniref:hypothetical protein n=1 Tax=Spirosoma sp. KNUC1025 TaxID=2894082 RepID=UPI00386E99E7|nr:hypothetical protein LN737_19045 [Spirosoma sp. KNUC1025]